MDIITLGKDKTIGYLAQYQDLAPHNSIYEEVKSVKAGYYKYGKETYGNMKRQWPIFQVLQLHNLIEDYTNLEHRFQLLDGYSYKSEIEGVIKGLGFTDG